MSYVIHNRYGSYCSVCHAVLTQDEADFDTCHACSGEDLDGDAIDDPINLAGSGPVPIGPREG